MSQTQARPQRRSYRGGSALAASAPALAASAPALAAPAPALAAPAPALAASAERRAWAVLVMVGDAYVPGALVVARSLRDIGSRYPAVCLVTPDVSAAARALLGSVFDEVREVPYIEHPSRPMPSKKQAEMYSAWIERSYTKWNVLALTEYAKVILLDADILFLKNCDDLFELQPPAACFSYPWSETWALAGVRNLYLPRPSPGDDTADARKRGAVRDLEHGARVPAATVLTAATGAAKAFVGCSAVTLLAPDAARLAELRRLVAPGGAPPYAEGRGCVNGVDEISIAEVYARAGVDWTHIHQRYEAIPWKHPWAGGGTEVKERGAEAGGVRAYHYQGRKPWDMPPGAWPDLAAWRRVADAMVAAPAGGALAAALAPPPAAQLAAAIAEVRLTWRLVDEIQRAGGRTAAERARLAAPPSRREAAALLLPWLAELAHGAGQPPDRRWARVYCRAPPPAAGAALAAALAAAGVGRAAAVAARLQALVDERLTAPPPPVAPATRTGDTLVCDGFNIPISPRIEHFIATAGLDRTAVALARHAAATPVAPARVTPAHADRLYERGFRYEAFTSPFDARFFGRPDAAYSSSFPDTDTPLGSAGDFFEVTDAAAPAAAAPADAWLVCPPPVAAIQAAAARRVALWLARGAHRAVFIADPAEGREACEVLDGLAADALVAVLVGTPALRAATGDQVPAPVLEKERPYIYYYVQAR